MNKEEILGKAQKISSEYHCVSCFDPAFASPEKDQNIEGSLKGYSITVKDCVAVKGLETKSSSRILEGYKPVFNATVVERIREQGGSILAKTVQDEFGFGTFCTNTGLDIKPSLNPVDKTRAAGGSSGGAACFTKLADFPHIAITESTGGSIAAPASFSGVVGICPTYGLVSRYGLLDYANSMDKIGVMANRTKDCARMLGVIAGKDLRDSTSLDSEKKDYEKELDKPVKGVKIGIIKEFLENIDEGVLTGFKKSVEALKQMGISIEELSLPKTAEYSLPAYYITAVSETSTNLAKFCGMRYGKHEELKGNFNKYFSKVRSEHFGKEAKRRVMLGTFARMAGFREAYYLKALKIRTLLIEEYKKAFERFDLLINPTMPILAPKFEEIEKLSVVETYMMDMLTCGANFCGFPHISVPCGTVKGLPAGLMLTGDHLKEESLLRISHQFERMSEK